MTASVTSESHVRSCNDSTSYEKATNYRKLQQAFSERRLLLRLLMGPNLWTLPFAKHASHPHSFPPRLRIGHRQDFMGRHRTHDS